MTNREFIKEILNSDPKPKIQDFLKAFKEFNTTHNTYPELSDFQLIGKIYGYKPGWAFGRHKATQVIKSRLINS